MLIDSHCHLNYEGLRENTDAVVARARAAGVTAMLSVNTKLREYDEIVALTERYPDVFGTVGIHPHEAGQEAGVAAQALIDRTAHPRIVGIGETGLDYYYDNAPRAQQRRDFAIHIKAARTTGLPLIVHSRDAEDDSTAMLREAVSDGPIAAVIHCFTGSMAFMEEMVGLGFHISLSGIVTFRNAKALREVARRIPDDRLLIETDSPFLAPVPHRGKTCEPAFVADTARFLADLRACSVEDIGRITGENFFRLFGKARAAPTE